MASVRDSRSNQFRGLESNQRPPRSERGVTTNSNCPGVREGGLEPPSPHSTVFGFRFSVFSFQFSVFSFQFSAFGVRCRPESARLLLMQGRRVVVSVRDRGVEPRSPGWKPGVVPLDQSRNANDQRKERESNPQGSSLARFRAGCRHPSACPSFSCHQLRRQESNLRPPG